MLLNQLLSRFYTNGTEYNKIYVQSHGKWNRRCTALARIKSSDIRKLYFKPTMTMTELTVSNFHYTYFKVFMKAKPTLVILNSILRSKILALEIAEIRNFQDHMVRYG